MTPAKAYICGFRTLVENYPTFSSTDLPLSPSVPHKTSYLSVPYNTWLQSLKMVILNQRAEDDNFNKNIILYWNHVAQELIRLVHTETALNAIRGPPLTARM